MTDEAQKIIAALRVVCDDRACTECPCFDWCNKNKTNCLDDDAADLIEELSVELEQVKRERDAAVADMEEMQGCTCQMCKHYYQPDQSVRKWSCRVLGEYWADICEHDGGLLECSNFEWRGVQEDDQRPD